METRFVTPSGPCEALIFEDDSLLIARLLEPAAPPPPLDVSAPDALADDVHGMLTAAELARWS